MHKSAMKTNNVLFLLVYKDSRDMYLIVEADSFSGTSNHHLP